ncbi:tRNA(Ile)-lysidine synthase [Enhygromyxa salina]|uniref:tRNA(Ile)-lysidine synthase n=1 Tax=Enhygromyxa salina TaxID=215803 RepID=A0A2S9YKC9_9BACT|nr:tRNA lysidine(34) synthetase TilS [Enhygromyxa salina]PRQ05543.1 tRNA(Ile)-lysidine synthase [Enhygromyxa salina]
MLDPESPPRSPEIAAALGPVRETLRAALGPGAGPRHLLVGCSGGPDSIAALGLLTILRRSEALELTVGHVDHGLRAESGAEADQVADVARGLGLGCLRDRVELEPGPGLPARAREARRAALRRQQLECGATAIVLAHTATDQVETMLMHLTRGAGLEGLAAMREYEPPWLRPLLELTRAQTRALCGQLELPFVDDPTNTNTEALRIWLRARVLPHLREHNPRLELALTGLARQAGDAEEALSVWAEAEVEERAGPRGWGLTGFDALPRAIRTRALRRMCELCGVDLTQLRWRVVEAMDASAVAVARARGRGAGSPSPAPRSWDLHPRCRIEINKNGVCAVQAARKRESSNH